MVQSGGSLFNVMKSLMHEPAPDSVHSDLAQLKVMVSTELLREK